MAIAQAQEDDGDCACGVIYIQAGGRDGDGNCAGVGDGDCIGVKA